LFITGPPPQNYSPETVTLASRKYLVPDAVPAGRGNDMRVNLIIYMLESFMDPEDLGWHYTSDPIPNFRELRRNCTGGHCIVPGGFGASANSEFEALTGMSLAFLSYRALPYKQFIKGPLPSLPGVLKHFGYRTIAVQADLKNMYNREHVYNLMGFDEVFWLNDQPDIERTADGAWPTDKAIVDRVILASQQARPFFIFAFPSSTHSPYNRNLHGNSDLFLLNPPPGDAASEVIEYINALREADRAIGALITHFKGQLDPTMIAIVGDHLPPLSDETLRLFNANLSGMSKSDKTFKVRTVPLLIWTNFGLPREDKDLSMNALPSYLLEKIGIASTGFLSVTAAVRRKVPILTRSYVVGDDGSVWDWNSLPREERALFNDYRLLQYDLLHGKQYSFRDENIFN
jgi:hypothetical protein